MSQNPHLPYLQQKPDSIQSLFNSIAKQYDLGNALLSLQMHRLWNRSLVRKVLLANQPRVCLDLCCGTGDILSTYLKSQKQSTTAYMLDFSEEMLEVAKQKASLWHKGGHDIRYIKADAQKIPLPNQSVDAVTIAYGIRNVQKPSICTQEAFRVLKNGGHFAILELTCPNNRFLKWGHQLYLNKVLPKLAKWISSNPAAYEYLSQSIQEFMPPEKMEFMLLQNGFSDVWCKPLMGGIATLVCGKKV